jgi:hypothetical protein
MNGFFLEIEVDSGNPFLINKLFNIPGWAKKIGTICFWSLRRPLSTE